MEPIYSWQAAYHAAVLETDPAQMPVRCYEALAAIEQRLLSLVDWDGAEFRALTAADHAIRSLKRETELQLGK
jgi:hypothetical protein